jgi:signal transduction histidine kinase
VNQGLWVVLTASLGVAVSGLFALHGRLRSVRRQHFLESDSLMKATELNQVMYSELQNKVEDRTKELREALAELEASRAEALVRERDAAIGVLASGMAHDMNSPLNAITLIFQALDEDLPPDSPSRPLLQPAKRAAQRCKRLVADLLAFSREPRMADAANLEEVVRRCLELFEADSAPTIRTSFEVIGEHVQLKLDKAQLQQAILNLLDNAADAMEGKGSIHLRLRTGARDVVLEIEDDAPGMTKEVQAQIFEPFFTTKKTGHGLGLAITRRLVSRNGGQVELESAPGAGTTFRLRFPLAKTVGATTTETSHE